MSERASVFPLTARLRTWAAVQPEQGDFRGELAAAAEQTEGLVKAIRRMAALPNDAHSRREMKRIGREALKAAGEC